MIFPCMAKYAAAFRRLTACQSTILRGRRKPTSRDPVQEVWRRFPRRRSGGDRASGSSSRRRAVSNAIARYCSASMRDNRSIRLWSNSTAYAIRGSFRLDRKMSRASFRCHEQHRSPLGRARADMEAAGRKICRLAKPSSPQWPNFPSRVKPDCRSRPEITSNFEGNAEASMSEAGAIADVLWR